MRNPKTPMQAWEDFKAAARKEEPNGIVTLSLIRDARVFTTASRVETENWEVLIGAASKQGMRSGLIAFGEELRDWSKKNGYRLALIGSGGAAAFLAAM